MHKKLGNELMDYLHILARRHIGQDLLKGCTDLDLELKMALILAYMGFVYLLRGSGSRRGGYCPKQIPGFTRQARRVLSERKL
jgi:hypothetical protein